MEFDPPGPDVCPDPLTLAAYQDGGLDVTRREALERHAVDCLACRDRLRALGLATEESIPHVRRSWAWSAAAGLLLAAAAWMLPKSAPPGRTPATGTSPAPRGQVARGAALLVDAGARARALDERRVRAESGTCWLEVTSGPAGVLEFPHGTATVRQGALAVTVNRSLKTAGFPFPATAWAEEEVSVEMTVLWGEAEVRTEGRTLRLGTGESLRTGSGAVGLVLLSGEALGVHRKARAMAAATGSGRSLLGGDFRDIPPAYRWVLVLTGRDSAAEVELSLGLEGGWRRWVPGLAARPPGGSEVVEVLWDAERLIGLIDGAPAFSVGRDQLEGLPAASKPGWGVRTWGGSVTVERSVLQETP